MSTPSAKQPLIYSKFLDQLKERITIARMGAARAVNRELILMYWDIGEAIVAKQAQLGWGESVIDQLSRDLLKAFPRITGFSPRNLRDMKRFYTSYASPSIWRQAVAKLKKTNHPMPTLPIWRQAVAKLDAPLFWRQAVAEIPWGHHLLILNKIVLPEARVYYLGTTAQFGWSRNVLLNQIKANAYERSHLIKKVNNFPVVLPSTLAEQAEEALKSSYSLEFLGIGREIKERELEEQLVNRVKNFILELGYGFCFIGNQYKLTLGSKDYFIDLLFYHRFLKSLVAIELKIGAFEPEYAGKMDFYLNLLNEKERAPSDSPSIGIILCAEKEDVEVEFALKSKTNPIGVAAYHLQPQLPSELKGKLPTAKQLHDVMQSALPIRAATALRRKKVKK